MIMYVYPHIYIYITHHITTTSELTPQPPTYFHHHHHQQPLATISTTPIALDIPPGREARRAAFIRRLVGEGGAVLEALVAGVADGSIAGMFWMKWCFGALVLMLLMGLRQGRQALLLDLTSPSLSPPTPSNDNEQQWGSSPPTHSWP